MGAVNLFFKVPGHGLSDALDLRTICPACRYRGVFIAPLSKHDVQITNGPNAGMRLGHRVCPNPDCQTHLFVVLDALQRLIVSYPPRGFEFDRDRVPADIAEIFEEAMICHSIGAYRGAAMLVRKTLELLCENKDAKGGNLKDRIDALRSKIIISASLFEVMTDLRFLGNDAAHLEKKTYDKVGEEEVSDAIDLTKEILRAVYQEEALVERMKRHKKPGP